MADPGQGDITSVESRQAVFKALLDVQDGGTGVAESRTVIARQFKITEAQVKQIEREGLDQEWPPL